MYIVPKNQQLVYNFLIKIQFSYILVDYLHNIWPILLTILVYSAKKELKTTA